MNLQELHYEITDLHRRVANLIRPGKVADADYAKARVRVRIGDLVTAPLRWLTHRAGGDVTWWAPEVGEQVLVLSPSGALAQGWVLPGGFGAAAPAPAASPDIHAVQYGDGFKIVHDRAARRTVLDAWDSQGTVEIRAKNIILKTGDGGFYHLDHAGYARRITHAGGAEYKSEAWSKGAVVTGVPDHGHAPPEVET